MIRIQSLRPCVCQKAEEKEGEMGRVKKVEWLLV